MQYKYYQIISQKFKELNNKVINRTMLSFHIYRIYGVLCKKRDDIILQKFTMLLK